VGSLLRYRWRMIVLADPDGAGPAYPDFASSPEAVQAALRREDYIADEPLATALFLALRMGKPLLIEGAPGVGKTEVAKAITRISRRELVRLQCYEGIDPSQALYEWNYQRQLLAIRQSDQAVDIYGDQFLIERPLLRVLRAPERRVLLIDEIDRSDNEFEALLLEFLSDFQISIPERDPIRASATPVVVLTSNRTRSLAEALRRRCIYHFIDYPDADREAQIILLRARAIAEHTARAVANAVAQIRQRPLAKAPGIAEAIEWASASTLLEAHGGDWPRAFRQSIGVLIKDSDDQRLIAADLDGILQTALA
jgi:MoxR-like ATPase